MPASNDNETFAASGGIRASPPRVWWPNLERIMLAVDDLGCRELLA
jgi:hypothetical protein